MPENDALPMHVWTIRNRGDHSATAHAAYFQIAAESPLIEFKDAAHKTVYAVARDCVLDIVRATPPSTTTA